MISLDEGRYHRQELITWWDQAALSRARVLVVGAGALGNEIVKNLALVGVGHVDVLDFDAVERSNLSRCTLFRERDEGRPKAEVLAESARDLNPGIDVSSHVGGIVDRGLAWYQGFDLIIAGLDNREARLELGRIARKLGKPWVDGAIEGLQGQARVFLAEGPCYECTLGDTDRRIMAARKSCTLLSTQQMLEGKVPTNSTTASIIAGVQVQEAIKILVGRPDLLALRNTAFMFVGDTMDTYVTGYSEDEWCPSHDRYGALEPWPLHPDATLDDLGAAVSAELGAVDAFDFDAEMLTMRRCPSCGWADNNCRPVSSLAAGEGLCPHCGAELSLNAGMSFAPEESIAQRPAMNLGLPRMSVVTVRSGDQRRHYIVGSGS